MSVADTFITTGDAVVPTSKPDHDVMTVYEIKFERGRGEVASCNWIVAGRMFRAKYPTSALQRVQRNLIKRKS